MQDDPSMTAVETQAKLLSDNDGRRAVVESDAAHAVLDRLNVPREHYDTMDAASFYARHSVLRADNAPVVSCSLTLSERINHLASRLQTDRDYASREAARVTRANEAVRALTAWVADQEKP